MRIAPVGFALVTAAAATAGPPAAPGRTWPPRPGRAARPARRPAAREREQRRGRERHREQVPVHEAVDQERRRQREAQGASPPSMYRHVAIDRGADPAGAARSPEEPGRACCRRPRRPARMKYIVRTGYSSHLTPASGTHARGTAAGPRRAAPCRAAGRCPSSRTAVLAAVAPVARRTATSRRRRSPSCPSRQRSTTSRLTGRDARSTPRIVAGSARVDRVSEHS